MKTVTTFVLLIFFGVCLQGTASADRAGTGIVTLNTTWIGLGNSVTLSYTLVNTSDAEVTLRIYDANGDQVRIIDGGIRSTGTYNITWNGCDNDDAPVPDGNYSLKIFVADENDEGPISCEPVYVGVDRTPPAITGSVDRPPASSGWYNASVGVHFTASDTGSGLAGMTPGGTVSYEGASQSAVGSAVDNAGNLATWTVDGINIDLTGPDIQIFLPEGNYTLNQPVTATWNLTDTLSGLSKASVPGNGAIDTGSVGLHNFTVEALDNAGNHAVKNATYSVRYLYEEVIQPRYSVFNRYSGIMPIAFRLRDYNDALIPSATVRLYLSMVTDRQGAEFPPLRNMSPTGDIEFSYMEQYGLYYYILYTGAMDSGTWQLRIALDDGTSRIYRIYIPG